MTKLKARWRYAVAALNYVFRDPYDDLDGQLSVELHRAWQEVHGP